MTYCLLVHIPHCHVITADKSTRYLLLPGAKLLLVESFGLLNDLFPFP